MATSSRFIRGGLRQVGLIYLTYAAIALVITVVASMRLAPDATGVRALGHLGVSLLMSAFYVVFAGVGLLFSHFSWNRLRDMLERSQVVAPELQSRRRWTWRWSMILYGAFILLASLAWSAYFHILTDNTMSWVLALFGACWLDLSRRVSRVERVHSVVYYWMPEPVWAWKGRSAVYQTTSDTGSPALPGQGAGE